MIFEIIKDYWLEALAVIFAIIYLFLVIKKDIRCWYAAIISSSLYFFVMLSANLYMEAYLQVFYIGMAVYGWNQWRRSNKIETDFVVKTWSINQHIYTISLIFILAFISGRLLETYTNAALPFIDALTTWGAIIATYMVAKKLIENWVYWFVIDAISVYLFASRGLILTSLLFTGYLCMIYVGYKSWSKIRDNNNAKSL